MNAEFNVWLLIVGLVVGAGLVWLVIMDSRRRETEVDAVERPREAAWLSAVMSDDGYDVSPEAAERLLLLHRAYLEAPPPDGAMDSPTGEPGEAFEPTAEPAPQPAVEPAAEGAPAVAATPVSYATPAPAATPAPTPTGSSAASGFADEDRFGVERGS